MAMIGLVGGPLSVVGAIFVLFGAWEQTSAAQFILTIPEIAWVASLGIYLIVKGFKPSPILSGAAEVLDAPVRVTCAGRGKLDRDALLARLPAGDRSAPAAGDQAALRDAVCAAWASVLGVEAEDDVPFFEAGGDSLDAMTFITALHEDTGHELGLAAFHSAPSVDGIVQTLQAPPEIDVPDAHQVTGRTVIPLRRGGGARLWCFLPPLSGAVTR